MEEFWTQIAKGVGGLENWTTFMDTICVSSLKEIQRGKVKGFGFNMKSFDTKSRIYVNLKVPSKNLQWKSANLMNAESLMFWF